MGDGENCKLIKLLGLDNITECVMENVEDRIF